MLSTTFLLFQVKEAIINSVLENIPELLVILWVIIETRRLQPKIATMIVARETVLGVIKEAGGSTAV